MLDMAGHVKLTFMGSALSGSQQAAAGFSVFTVAKLGISLSILLREPRASSSHKRADCTFAPCILLAAEYFYALLQHRHGKWPSGKMPNLQFDMA
jgi:hypothetical protein